MLAKAILSKNGLKTNLASLGIKKLFTKKSTIRVSLPQRASRATLEMLISKEMTHLIKTRSPTIRVLLLQINRKLAHLLLGVKDLFAKLGPTSVTKVFARDLTSTKRAVNSIRGKKN